jgi:hypothetical protein
MRLFAVAALTASALALNLTSEATTQAKTYSMETISV